MTIYIKLVIICTVTIGEDGKDMPRTPIIAEREQLHVLILRSQAKEIEKYEELYNRTKTEIIEEALQYWINEQVRLYGEKLEV